MKLNVFDMLKFG